MEPLPQTVCEVESQQRVIKLLKRRYLKPAISSIGYSSTLDDHLGRKTRTFVCAIIRGLILLYSIHAQEGTQ